MLSISFPFIFRNGNNILDFINAGLLLYKKKYVILKTIINGIGF